MTANELAEIADGLSCEIPIREWIDNEPKNVMNDIATMLRQQQAEIEKLKNIVEDTIGQAFYEDDYHKAQAEIEALKLRELTDEEIMQICSQIEPFDDTTIEQAFIEFAKAILKKASEK